MANVKDVIFVQSERHDVSYVLRICGVAALGGILLGYDTSVVSGAITPLQEFFHLSAAQTGWAVSNVIVGCIIGALCSGWLADYLGRRLTLFLCALLFAAQSIGSALAPDFLWFVMFRMAGGVAVGVASAVSPMYMSEVSPKDMRGRALSMEQFAMVSGQLLVFIVNYLIAAGGSAEWLRSAGWRWMFASEIVPCILFCATIFLIPESPRWHVLRGRDEDALRTLSRISNEEHALKLVAEIRGPIGIEREESLGLTGFWRDHGARWIVFVGAMIAGLQQVTGINVMLYYAPMLLRGASGSFQAALFKTIWIGAALVVGCVIGAWVVDRWGRKPLMEYGSIGMVFGLLAVSLALYCQSSGVIPLLGMLVFMVAFGLSWGPVCWILIAEIFPNRFRAVGMSIAVATQWAMNFLVSQFFPMLNQYPWLNQQFHGAFSMWLFAGFGLFSMWFILRFVPETKGVALEHVEQAMMEYRGGRARARHLIKREAETAAARR